MNVNFQYLKEVASLIGDDKKGLIGMVFSFLALSLLDIASISIIIPYISLIVTPEIFFENETVKVFLVMMNLENQFKEVIVYISILLLSIFFIKALAGILINRRILKYCFNQGAMMRIKLMSAYQNLPYEEYLQRNSSEYVYSIEHLSAQFSQTVLQSFLRLTSESVVVIAILIFLAFNSILALGVLIVLFGFSMFIYDYFFKHRVKGYGENANIQSTKIVKGVHEGIEGLKEIRVLGKESYFHQMVSKGAISFKKSSVNAQTISQAPRYILDLLLMTFVVVFVLIMGSKKEIEILIPILGLFGVAAMRIAPSINQIISSLSHIRFGRHGVSLLYKDVQKINLSSYQKNFESARNYKFKEFKYLKVKNVSFKYQDINRHAVKDISIKIKAGDSVGIIGSSGSGKTTLIDLLLGLLTPQEGAIFYNDLNVRDNYSDYLSQIAYLPQQVFMSDSTLLSNVALGTKSEDIDIQKVNYALDKSSLSEFVKSLPNGLNTIIGERGVKLSGGQRQRIALARAFYYDRSILVMDESTSALDNKTEQAIINQIRDLKREKTIILIAHRLTSLQHCDYIYKIEGGSISNLGSYEDMIKGV
jgi:ATP-binding cassette, subfamily B, bacterial PglK